MPKWTEYTMKDTLADNDEVMLYDATGKANKRGLMSKFWDYVVDKMSTAVISKLETENKTVIGAINALNSDKVNYGIYFGDLNEIPFIKANIQIFHRSQPDCKNVPVQEYGIVRTMYVNSTEYAIQEFLSLLTAKLYVRNKLENIWTEWKEK
jgi:hypothetical protein|nr:MAG TPA: hypothetical protein [Herelleviridae sp.]